MFEESARLVVWLVPVIVIAVIILPQMIRILREYERGVIFRLGKLLGTKGQGVIFVITIVDRMVRMDLRVVTIDIARQEVMTRDNVPMTVDAVVYFRVVEPAAAVVRVEKYLKATSLISQTTLRSVLGQAELNGHRHVVACHDFLARDVDGHDAQIHPHHAIDDRDQENQAGPFCAEQFAETENHTSLVLAQDADHLRQDETSEE